MYFQKIIYKTNYNNFKNNYKSRSISYIPSPKMPQNNNNNNKVIMLCGLIFYYIFNKK